MDIDGDGHRDILSGSYSRMEQDMAGLFQVLHGKADGTFRRAEVLKGTDGEPLIIPIKGREQMTENICTRPFAVDWDGDGQLDLVVGNFAGTFYWFKGQGKGKFPPRPELIKAGDSPLRVAGAAQRSVRHRLGRRRGPGLAERVQQRRRAMGGEPCGQGQGARTRSVPTADSTGPADRVRAAPRAKTTSPAPHTRPESGSTT